MEQAYEVARDGEYGGARKFGVAAAVGASGGMDGPQCGGARAMAGGRGAGADGGDLGGADTRSPEPDGPWRTSERSQSV